MKKVSFDFDDTLEYESTQKFAKRLIELGIEVHITTSRYEDLANYLPIVCPNGHNDLFKVAEELDIPKEHIHFTNFVNKYNFLKTQDFIWHLDDNDQEIYFIMLHTKTKGIWFLQGNWDYDCAKLLGLENDKTLLQ